MPILLCVMPKSFNSSSNCEVQLLRPKTMRRNHEFLCSDAPSSG